MREFDFDLQRFWRDSTDVTYRGNRRWSGNYGRVWIDGSMLFELNAFEIKVIADREDVTIGNSKDSKIVSLTGEGTITIKKVFNRGFKTMLDSWKKGKDKRMSLVGKLKDPDMLHEGEERIEVTNLWFNELDIMHFTKGEVVETEIPFGFTPEDLKFTKIVKKGSTASRTTNVPPAPESSATQDTTVNP